MVTTPQFLTRLLLAIALPLSAGAGRASEPTLVEFGRALFFDGNLSEPAGQSCANCHDPARAFSDSRRSGANGALSLGADGVSLGDRNAPALTYLGAAPAFELDNLGARGGFFHDGRAATLEAQALDPLLDPKEMALADVDTLAARVRTNPAYASYLSALMERGEHTAQEQTIGADAVATADASAIAALVTRAIAAFERSEAFSTFDSRYDRYLAGTYEMSRDEAIGREIFFSDLVNCIQCHLNQPGRVSARETFTNHRFENIGLPINARARAENGLGEDHRDAGLGDNPAIADVDADARGRFRVPSLRNVAVTAPYMHNGVFESLETAVAYYGKFTLNTTAALTNPDTGQPWGEPEVPDTVNHELLDAGQPIDDARVRQLTAFLRTLTDARYEHLLEGN